MVCWTETELPITNSPAYERLISLICNALQRAGQSFISEHMRQVAALFASHSGIGATGYYTYTRRHLGITMMLRSWLRDASCGALLETHSHTLMGMDTHEIHQAAYVIEVSAGQPAYEAFVQQTLRCSQRIKPLVLRTEVIEETEYSALCNQLEEELAHEDFCGLLPIVRAWAPHL